MDDIPNPYDVNRAIAIAQLRYGGEDGTFTAAGFSVALWDLAGRHFSDAVERQVLLDHPNVRQLSGGSHWRYVPEVGGEEELGDANL